jgi:hypothetical protein
MLFVVNELGEIMLYSLLLPDYPILITEIKPKAGECMGICFRGSSMIAAFENVIFFYDISNPQNTFQFKRFNYSHNKLITIKAVEEYIYVLANDDVNEVFVETYYIGSGYDFAYTRRDSIDIANNLNNVRIRLNDNYLFVSINQDIYCYKKNLPDNSNLQQKYHFNDGIMDFYAYGENKLIVETENNKLVKYEVVENQDLLEVYSVSYKDLNFVKGNDNKFFLGAKDGEFSVIRPRNTNYSILYKSNDHFSFSLVDFYENKMTSVASNLDFDMVYVYEYNPKTDQWLETYRKNTYQNNSVIEYDDDLIFVCDKTYQRFQTFKDYSSNVIDYGYPNGLEILECGLFDKMPILLVNEEGYGQRIQIFEYDQYNDNGYTMQNSLFFDYEDYSFSNNRVYGLKTNSDLSQSIDFLTRPESSIYYNWTKNIDLDGSGYTSMEVSGPYAFFGNNSYIDVYTIYDDHFNFKSRNNLPSALDREILLSDSSYLIIREDDLLQAYAVGDNYELEHISAMKNPINTVDMELHNGLLYLATGNGGIFEFDPHFPPVKSPDLPEIDNDSLTICLFPNPAIDMINLHFMDEDPGLFIAEISDVDGRLYGRFSLSGNINTLDVSELDKGIYHLRITFQEEVKVIRFLISR